MHPCSRCSRLQIRCLPPIPHFQRKDDFIKLKYDFIHATYTTSYAFVKETGCPLLFWAAEYGHCRVIRLLLEMGVPVDSRNKHGSTSLHIAIRFNQSLPVQTLLAAGAQVNVATREWVKETGAETPVFHSVGDTPLQLWFRFTPLELPILRSLISAGENPDQDVSPFGDTLLHWLSRRSAKIFSSHYEQIMEYLVSDGRAQVDALQKLQHYTPLDCAIAFKNHRAMRILLAAETNLNFRESGNTINCPLYLAVKSGSIDSVKLLVEAKADPNGSEHQRPLALAADEGQYEIAEVLLSAGADPSLKIWGTRMTPLHIAVAPGPEVRSEDLIRALLNAGADIESRDGKGETPLHRAASKRDVNAIRILLLSGAQVNALSDFDETPIFHLFDWFRRTYSLQNLEAVVRILVEAGTDVTIRNKDGRTVLDRVLGYYIPEDFYSSVFSNCFRILFHAWEKALSSGAEIRLDWETVSIEALKDRYRTMKRVVFGYL